MNFTELHWSADYDTGIEEVDLQHRYFVVLINRLHKELLTSQDELYCSALIEELFKYAMFHFLSEENIMFKIGYPDLEEHRKRHFDLLDKLSLRASQRHNEELLEFLVEWFFHHVQQDDHLIGEFVRHSNQNV